MMLSPLVHRTCLALLAAAIPASLHADELPLPVSEIQRSEPVDFAKEIVPLLKKNCLACHHAKEAEGGLNLETHKSLMAGGDSGPAVVAKDVAASLLMTRATGAEEPLMPPEDNSVGARPFTPEELGLIKLWIDQGAPAGQAMTAQVIDWQPIPESIRTVYALDVSADGRWVASGQGNRVVIWDLQSKAEVGRLVDPSLAAESLGEVADVDLIQSIAFSPQGDRIATGGYRTVKLWQQVDPRVSLQNHALATASGPVAINDDRSALAMVNAIGDIEIRRSADAALLQTLASRNDRTTELAWAGDRLIQCDERGRLVLWQPSDGKQLASVDAGTPLHRLRLSADGAIVAAINHQRQLAAWRVKSAQDGKLILEATEMEAAKGLADVTAIAMTVKPTPTLFVAHAAGSVQWINLADGKKIRQVEHGTAVGALAVRADGAQLATGGQDGKTRTWNIADGKPLLTLEGEPRQRIQLAKATADAA
ncbi:MAG: hypothetical protein MI861_16970, partial [Pirellulales bacterium]|nr:hypothetical protein [Pirellulales bacterium]